MDEQEKVDIEVRSDQSRSLLARLRLPWVDSNSIEFEDKLIVGPYHIQVNGTSSGATTGGIRVVFNENETVSVVVKYITMEEPFSDLIGLNLSEGGELSSKSVKLNEVKIIGPGKGCDCLEYLLEDVDAKMRQFEISIDKLLEAEVVFTSDKLRVSQSKQTCFDIPCV